MGAAPEARNLLRQQMLTEAQRIFGMYISANAPLEINLPSATVDPLKAIFVAKHQPATPQLFPTNQLETPSPSIKRAATRYFRISSRSYTNTPALAPSLASPRLQSLNKQPTATSRSVLDDDPNSRITPFTFDEAQEQVLNLMEKDSLRRYQRSPLYTNLKNKLLRRHA
eukprot:TRINITY_DN9723_c0_g1_i2.p1 TRINITY_DN9723_c0_g1~~TRINITY_DN9723_c0_g1_i2.p1  ORF type:complete len:178 (-),score=49.44 TRINITY_DN9723_c0_g1_i2:106-612(-)